MSNKVILIIGTRPEAIKLLPVYKALKDSEKFEPIIVSTGQHREMLDQVFSIFNVQPEIELNLMTINQSLSGLTSLLFAELDKVIKNVKPVLVIVQGDTQSAYVGAMTSYYNQIRVAHIEAGLRTYDIYSPFPEEVNRQGIGLVADFSFAPTKDAAENLVKEGKKNIHIVGNTVIDALKWCRSVVDENKSSFDKKYEILGSGKKVLITGHRRENLGGGLDQISNAIKELATRYKEVSFIYPVHLNPNVREVVFESLSNIDNVHLIDPVSYDEMVYLLSESYMVITDSGGIQEEGPSFDLPILVTRETTERPEGIEAGCSILVGAHAENIIHRFEEIHLNEKVYKQMSESPNPYGNGNSSAEIVRILIESF